MMWLLLVGVIAWCGLCGLLAGAFIDRNDQKTGRDEWPWR